MTRRRPLCDQIQPTPAGQPLGSGSWGQVARLRRAPDLVGPIWVWARLWSALQSGGLWDRLREEEAGEGLLSGSEKQFGSRPGPLANRSASNKWPGACFIVLGPRRRPLGNAHPAPSTGWRRRRLSRLIRLPPAGSTNGGPQVSPSGPSRWPPAEGTCCGRRVAYGQLDEAVPLDDRFAA